MKPYRLIFAACLLIAMAMAMAMTTARSASAQNPEYGTPLKAGASVAFFGITFIDTSTEGAFNGVRADETERTALLESAIAGRMRDAGFTLVDTAPVEEEKNSIINPADCNGCEVRMARKLGADYALVGEVQKVSNLILSMNLVLRSTASGNMVRGLSVDIRGNNDKSWLRGMKYIFENNFFREE